VLPKKEKNKRTITFLNRAGAILVALAFVITLIVFLPLVVSELKYRFAKKSVPENATVSIDKHYNFLSDTKEDVQEEIVAIDKDFSIVIPKIGANYKVIKDVDPYDSKIYQAKLAKGVAHALGSVYPNEVGNSFYFAHSSDTIFNANRYNAMFYLLNKLDLGDSFFIVYEERVYKYKVIDFRQVSGNMVDLLTLSTDKKLATLMTCWPPGTTLKRYLVIGQQIEN
jgi:sortase A